jgi:hypothetical protein
MRQFHALALAVSVSHALVAPPQCARHAVTARSDYLDSMAPPAAAAPEEAAPEAEVIEEPAPPAPPAPMSLSESVLGEFSARSERNLEVARLQTQLERSQLRRKQVEEVIGEEVAALRFQLEREMAAERDRAASAAQLQQQLADAKAQKMERCRREEQLLVQLQDVRQRTSEDAVAASLAAAIETKAGLVAIELVLIEDVDECSGQIKVEQDQINARIEAMETTLASLPATDDGEALRLYSWQQVEALQAQLAESAIAIAETEASVAALRQRINDALDQRDAVLGAAPLGAAQPVAPSVNAGPAVPPPSRSAVQQIDVESLDDAALKDAAASSAKATLNAFQNVGKSLLAFAGNFQASADRAEASKLLSEATNTTSALTRELADSGEVSQSEAAAIARDAASSTGQIVSNLGGAASSAAKAASNAANDAEVGAALGDAFTALGNTVASVGVLAGRAASGAAGGDLKLPDVKLPGGLPKLPDLPGLPGQKKGPPSGFDE